jgi:sugar phosphate isomerase/epimerase
MLKAISTHILLRHRLHPGLLDTLARSGAEAIEIYAARQHFDYTSRTHIQEIANWFRSNPVQAFSMHAPLYANEDMGRDGAPGVNVVHPEKSRRIDAMDEIKRAIEVAEKVPFKYLVVHLGERHDTWSARTLEHSLTALEHLRAFASPLGVKLNVENIVNDVTTPAHLIEILNAGHFTDIGVCFDSGHANITDSVRGVFNELKSHIRSTHLHDNHGAKDEHLWPGEGTIDWADIPAELKTAPKLEVALLEISGSPEESPEAAADKAAKCFTQLEVA